MRQSQGSRSELQAWRNCGGGEHDSGFSNLLFIYWGFHHTTAISQVRTEQSQKEKIIQWSHGSEWLDWKETVERQQEVRKPPAMCEESHLWTHNIASFREIDGLDNCYIKYCVGWLVGKCLSSVSCIGWQSSTCQHDLGVELDLASSCFERKRVNSRLKPLWTLHQCGFKFQSWLKIF